MKNILSKGQLSILIVLGILILDQVIKIEVKTNMFYNESIHITDWFYLRFIENPGMAFGMQIVPKPFRLLPAQYLPSQLDGISSYLLKLNISVAILHVFH